MSSLLIYVEENLIFLPEKCYEEETNMSDCNKKNSPKEALNVPLISPQSTLMNDKLFKPPFELTSPNKQQEVLPKVETPDEIFQNDSMPTTFTASKNNVNPFLQEEPVQNPMKNEINPQKFMQLWTENLTLQMQITSTLNILLKSALLCNKEQTSAALDFVNASITNTSGETVSSTLSTCSGKNIGINHDFANVQHPVENFTFTPADQQPLTTTLYNRNYDLNTYTDLFQNTNVHSAIESIGTTNFNSLTSTNNDFDTGNQSLEDQKTSIKSNILCDKFVKEFKSGQQNYFGNSNIDPIPAENSINNEMPLKETNPFRLSLAGKLQISDSQEEDFSCTNSNSVVERDLISFESNDSNVKSTNHNILHDCKDTSFNHYVTPFVTDSSNNIKSVRNNPFVLDYDLNVDNVTNTMSEINIDGQFKQYNVNKVEVETDCFSSSKKCFAETFNCEIANENLTFGLNYDTNNFSSSTLLPTNSLETPTLADNVNINEGYLTPLNTSLYSKEHELQTVWKNTNMPEYLFSNYTVFFQLIELPNGIVHVFHHQEEGWLLTDEFVKMCTQFETTSNMIKLLDTLNICAHFKEIDRTKNLIKFLKSSSILTKATQDVITGTGKLHLISLKSALKVLCTLEIISRKDLNDVFIHDKFTNGSIAHKIWSIINAYKQLKEHVKNGQTYF
ncbi:hypothetical protein ANTRET_LOCUS623 [Anthophora retusa]